MRASPSSLVLAALFATFGCTRQISYDPDGAQKLQRVAIVVRVLGSAGAELPEAARGGRTPEDLGKKIDLAMSSFEVAERLRSGLIQHLPDSPPWNTVVPAVEAESALGDMLTVDHPAKSPDFDDLQRLGIDGVLYVQVDRWGVRGDDAQSGFWMQGTGRFFTLPGHDTLWQTSIDTVGVGSLGVGWSEVQSVRNQLTELCARAGESLAEGLGGSSQSVQRTGSLQQPDIEDVGHPPDKVVPVIPFVMPDARDGGARPEKNAGIDISFPDGGDIPVVPSGR